MLKETNNQAILKGTIGYIKKFEGRTSVLRFQITTVDERYDGQPIYAHVNCRSFGKHADKFFDEFKENDSVIASGRIENSSYINRNGDKAYEQYVTVIELSHQTESEKSEKAKSEDRDMSEKNNLSDNNSSTEEETEKDNVKEDEALEENQEDDTSDDISDSVSESSNHESEETDETPEEDGEESDTDEDDKTDDESFFESSDPNYDPSITGADIDDIEYELSEDELPFY